MVVSLSSHGFEERNLAYVMPPDGIRGFLEDSALNLGTVETRLAVSRLAKADLDRARQQVQARVQKLKDIFAADQLAPEQLKQGRALLEADSESLDEPDRQRRKIYSDLADGKLSVEYLQAAMDKVETPEQRAARLERGAREKAQRDAQEKADRIASLLARARANDSKENGKVALAALDELDHWITEELPFGASLGNAESSGRPAGPTAAAIGGTEDAIAGHRRRDAVLRFSVFAGTKAAACCAGRRGTTTIPATCCPRTAITTRPTIATTTKVFGWCWRVVPLRRRASFA